MKKMRIITLILIYISFLPIALSKERNVIYVYNDEGVSQESLTHTLYSFRQHAPQYLVKTIDATQLKSGHWIDNAILFVMPGGADLPYAKRLNGRGNLVLKNYVSAGGSFLGICAGSYYGSSYVEFDKNGDLEVLGNRELQFFKGTAIGPILAPYDYKSQSGSRAARIQTTLPGIPETVVYYNGGGYFRNANQYKNTRVIAVYENHLPAIISVKYGKGMVLLSGVHFEYDPSLLTSHDDHMRNVINEIRSSNHTRVALFTRIVQLSGVKSIISG